MIKNIIKIAKENNLLKRINARIKAKEKNLEENRKRYWKLSPSERLHYDYRIDKIEEDNSSPIFFITWNIAKVYFFVLVVFTLYKVLFQVDPTLMVRAFLKIIGTAPIIFRFSILLDILFILLGFLNKKKAMKYLNEKYGFKKV